MSTQRSLRLALHALYVLSVTNLPSSTALSLGSVRIVSTWNPSHIHRRRCLQLYRQKPDRYYDDEYEDDDEYVRGGRVDDLGDFQSRTGLDLPSSYGRRDGWRLPESVSKSLLAGVFVLGIGLGVTIDSQVNTNPKDLASRDAIDNAAPNPTLCAKLGASAMAFDQRVFVSFNPFNVYVSQADVKPACVLLEANVVPVLRARGLINDSEVRSCKQNMNTWAFVGSLDDTPQLSCVYKSQDAQNEFLSNPKLGIGEDYLDDDLERLDTRKNVKDGLTEAQKQLLRSQMLKDRQST
jgi:Protein of unknown function (DUF3172)